jgi:hypothetical protein
MRAISTNRTRKEARKDRRGLQQGFRVQGARFRVRGSGFMGSGFGA